MGDSRPTPGIEADWDAIFRDHEWRVRRFLWGKVPVTLMDDVVQDTFLRAYRSRHRFDPAKPPGPWLITIARRARAEALRVLPPAMSPEVEGLAAIAGDADPHLDFERQLRRQAMAMALRKLSPRHRRLIIEWELKGELDFATLAGEEGITPQALKSVLSRARNAFRTSYATAAERTGAAAAVVWSRVLRRSRARSTGWSATGVPLMEAAMGGMAAVVTATVLLQAAPSSSARNLSLHLASDIGAMAVADVPVPGTTDAIPRRQAYDARATEHGYKPSARSSHISPLNATATADIGVGPSESTATLTLGFDDVAGPLHVTTEVEVRCEGALRSAVCASARRTPLAQ